MRTVTAAALALGTVLALGGIAQAGTINRREHLNRASRDIYRQTHDAQYR